MSLETAIRYFYRPDLDPYAELLEKIRRKTRIYTLELLEGICTEMDKSSPLSEEQKLHVRQNLVFCYIKLNAKELKISDVKKVLEKYSNAFFIGDLLDVFILHQNPYGVVEWYKCRKQQPNLTKITLVLLADYHKNTITACGFIQPIIVGEIVATMDFLWPELV